MIKDLNQISDLNVAYKGAVLLKLGNMATKLSFKLVKCNNELLVASEANLEIGNKLNQGCFLNEVIAHASMFTHCQQGIYALAEIEINIKLKQLLVARLFRKG